MWNSHISTSCALVTRGALVFYHQLQGTLCLIESALNIVKSFLNLLTYLNLFSRSIGSYVDLKNKF